MIYAHILVAILAAWRITELFTVDRITDRLRKRFPTYLWQCPRCMSVWAGGWTALVLFLGQTAMLGHLAHSVILWLNWPFALSWMYLWHLDYVSSKRIAARGREMIVRVAPTGQWSIAKTDLTLPEMQSIAVQMVAPAPAQAPVPAPAQSTTMQNGAAVHN